MNEPSQQAERVKPSEKTIGDDRGYAEGYKDATDAHQQAMRESTVPCHICGKPSVCFGAYEDPKNFGFSCGECCGHGNEDGWCKPIAEVAQAMREVEKQRDQLLRDMVERGQAMQAAQEEIARLKALWKTLSEQAFMQGATEENVAAHLSSVAKSYLDATRAAEQQAQGLEERVKELEGHLRSKKPLCCCEDKVRLQAEVERRDKQIHSLMEGISDEWCLDCGNYKSQCECIKEQLRLANIDQLNTQAELDTATLRADRLEAELEQQRRIHEGGEDKC